MRLVSFQRLENSVVVRGASRAAVSAPNGRHPSFRLAARSVFNRELNH